MAKENCDLTKVTKQPIATRPEVQQPVRRPAIWVIHALVFALCGSFAFVLHFDFAIPVEYVPHWIAGAGIWVSVKLAVMHLEGLDRGWTRLLSSGDVARLLRVSVKASLLAGVLILLLGPPGFPPSIYFTDLALAFVAISGLYTFVEHWAQKPVASGLRSKKAGI